MLDLLIITGATRGIGNNIAKKCVDICKIMLVIGSSKKVEKLESTDLIGSKCDVNHLQLDLSKYSIVENKIEEKIHYINSINQINNLGIILCGAQLGEPGGLFSTNLKSWDETYKCNVLGNLAVIKGCQKIIESGAKTKIVFFSGGGGAYANEKFSSYALTKCAVIREVENLSIELNEINKNLSIIALSPGAIQTDMLKIVEKHGGFVKTYAKIEEPTEFCYNFLTDQFPSKEINGRFIHVRDDLKTANFSNKELFKLRRIQ